MWGMVSRRWLGLLLIALMVAAFAVACEEEEEEATPTPPVAETPTEVAETPTAVTPTPAALKPGAAGIPSNPRQVRGLEGVITLDDGLAIWKERPADEDRTGVTADTIKLGRHMALSGPGAVVAVDRLARPVLEAIFERVNEAGGIHGRQIEIVTRDDLYTPPGGVEAARRLIEEDKIFATLLSMGGPPHTASHPLFEAAGVPEVWVFAAEQGDVMHTVDGYRVDNRTDFPFYISNLMRGFLMTDVFYKENPDAKVAVLYQNDSAGAYYLEGAQAAAELRGKELVAEIGYDIGQPDLTAQAYQVAESGADAVANFAVSGPVVAFAKALWETVGSDIPMSVVMWYPPEGSDIMDGVYATSAQATDYLFPDLPLWAKVKALAEEEGFVYISSIAAIAVTAAEFMIRALELAGPDLTREGLIEALETGFDGTWTCNACLAPPILGPHDHWALESVLLSRWSHAEQTYCSINRQPGEPCWPTGDPMDEVESYETSLGKGPLGNFPGWECAAPGALPEFPEGTCPWKEGG